MGRYYSFDANVHLQRIDSDGSNGDELEDQDVVASVFWEERQVQKVVNFIVDSDGDADMEYFHHKHPKDQKTYYYHRGGGLIPVSEGNQSGGGDRG